MYRKNLKSYGKYNIFSISETWWDWTHNWNSWKYIMFKKNKNNKKSEGIALYIKHAWHKGQKPCWKHLKGYKWNRNNRYFCGCKKEDTDKIFANQMANVSRKHTDSENLNYSDMNWISHSAISESSTRFMIFLHTTSLSKRWRVKLDNWLYWSYCY